ncbi:hypothetical protein CF327_g1294 [Tilletia walkeri]|nr:hypothetical protein CF327_g1294 [Tilletia walkeri]
MPLRKTPTSLITKALTSIALELASDKTINKFKESSGISDRKSGSSSKSRTYSNVGRKDRRYDDDDDELDSEEEYERNQQRRRRRDSSTAANGGSSSGSRRQPRYDDYDDDDDVDHGRHRRAPPPLVTGPGPGPSGSRKGNGQYSSSIQILQPGAAAVGMSTLAYDEYGNSYHVQPAQRSASNDQPQPRMTASRNGSMDDSQPRPRRSSVHSERPHVAFADEVDERDRADRPVPVRHSQLLTADSQRPVVPPPALPSSISGPSGSQSGAVSSSSSSQHSSAAASPHLTSSPVMDTHVTASIGGAGLPIREIIYAARCSHFVYSITTESQAKAFLRTAESNPSHPLLTDVVFDSPPDNVRNWALFRKRSDNVFYLAVRGSGKKGSEWATDIFRSVAGGGASLDEVTPILLQDGSVLYAHSGLLQCVLAMMRQIISILELRSAKYSRPRLIVCGHSSGGAIASLIYIMLEHNYQTILDRFRTIHCISFGSPPCVRSQDIITSRPLDGLFGIVMKGDPIPRMDRAYVADILNKYPIQMSALYSQNKSYSAAPTDAVEGALLSIATFVAGKNVERPPKQSIIPAGKLVLLDPQKTDIWDMSKEYLEECPFYNIGVHPLPLHLQCLERLEAAHPDMVLD